MSPSALILDSGANIHILNNMYFLACITSCLGQYINTAGSHTLCNKVEWLYGALKSLPLPATGYLYQSNGIGNIISLSLLSDTHWIIKDTDLENAFYVFNRDNGSYMKYTRCAKSNRYTYVIRTGKEHKVLLHSTIEVESEKDFSDRLDLNKSCL